MKKINDKKMEEIVIIGAGASGLMAMAKIIEKDPNKKITIIEKNEKIGKKILITGGGRCNLTNAEQDIKKLLENYPRSKNFLKFAQYDFSPQKVMEWFEEKGVPLKIEENKRVFPISNKAISIVNVFEEIINKHKINLLINSSVVKIIKKTDYFEIYLDEKKESIKTKKLLITSGGNRFLDNEKLNFAYETAKNFGHKIIELKAGLSALISNETIDLAGISFKNIKARLKKEQIYEKTGDILFTHKGISGPAIFALSSMSAYEEFTNKHPAILYIDFFPNKNFEELKEEIVKKCQNSKIQFSNILAEIITKKLAKKIFPTDKKANEISKKELNQTLEKLKNFQIKITARVNGEEIVTVGGIDTKEINEKTMESKLCKNLYFAGEVLNIDGFTGGFNLQAAWATGKVAGENII